MKFRVWNDLKKEYFSKEQELFLLNQNGTLMIYNLVGKKLYVPENVYKIEYSSGLLDKNGKEIFVGDIVKTDELINQSELSGKSFAPGDTISLTKVKFLEIKNIFSYQHRIFDTPMEIVGNILENPELLENKK